MQIKLKKYFMIIPSATVGLHQWERERNTLTTSRDIPTRKHAGKPTICVRKSLNAAIIRCPSALNFAAYNPPPFCLTCFTNNRLTYLDLTISIVKSVHEGTPSDRALSHARPPGGREQIERMCHNWRVGRETLQYIGSCIQTTRTTNLSKHLRENLLHKSLVVDFCV